MSQISAFLTLALLIQLLFLLRLIRNPEHGPALFLPILALAAAAAVIVHAAREHNLVLLLGQAGLAVLYILHLLRRGKNDA